MGVVGERTLSREWRLLVTGAGSASWNMALDEALYESVQKGGAPFLRFYSWSPSALSLGRFQHRTEGLTPLALSIPTVRRLTGGGAIWHSQELTYSVGCSQDDLGVTGVKPSFERLCGFLVDTWRDLGWSCGYAKDIAAESSLGRYTPACFAGKEEYDILVNGRKLGGNAQKRDRRTIFQHGSIPVALDPAAHAALFRPEFCPLPDSLTDLRTCGWSGSIEALIPVLAARFWQRVGGVARQDQPSPAEADLAERRARERFDAPDWTENGGGSIRSSTSSEA